MRLVILAALLVAAPAMADVPSSAATTCAARDGVVVAVAPQTATTDGFHRLDRLPPAAEYLALYRRVGSCPAPVVVRFDIGNPRR